MQWRKITFNMDKNKKKIYNIGTQEKKERE